MYFDCPKRADSSWGRVCWRGGLWIIVGVICCLSACSKHTPTAQPVRAVKVLTVKSHVYGSSYEYAGEIRARIESNLSFRASGKVVTRSVRLGQRVKAGEVLAQLDPKDLRLEAEGARAALTSALSARDLAVAEFKRYKELWQQNFISSAELERREATLKAAQAQWEQAQAAHALRDNQLAYATLLADAPGVVTALDVEVGQMVSAGVPVLRLAHDGARDVAFAIPEDRLAGMQLGTQLTLKLWAQDEEMTAAVREVAASADPLTRTYSVRATVHAQHAPALGATVFVTPHGTASARLAGRQVMTVPTTALRHDGKSSAVWALDLKTMTVNSVPVRVSTADGDEAVIASGLQEGMVVVSTGVHALSPGQKVVIYQEKSTEYVREYGQPTGSPSSVPSPSSTR